MREHHGCDEQGTVGGLPPPVVPPSPVVVKATRPGSTDSGGDAIIEDRPLSVQPADSRAPSPSSESESEAEIRLNSQM